MILNMSSGQCWGADIRYPEDTREGQRIQDGDNQTSLLTQGIAQCAAPYVAG